MRSSEAGCPLARGTRVVNTLTGETTQAMCKRNTCPACARWKVSLLRDALHLASPTHFVTIALAGGHWVATQARLARYRRLCRDRGIWVADATFVEPYSRGGHHLHQYVRADDEVAYDALEDAAVDAGAGQVPFIEHIRHHGNLGYGLKMATSADTLPAYLEANGGQLVHASRGFWTDADGVPTSGGYLAVARAARGAQMAKAGG